MALDLTAPDISDDDWVKLRDGLGAPEARLDFYRDVVAQNGGLWVYASRGLALYTSLDGEQLDRIVVFVPTTVEDFRDHLAMAQQPPRERRR